MAIDWIQRRALLQTAEEVRTEATHRMAASTRTPSLMCPYYKQITGPWDATPIYDIPPPFNGTALMAYSGKAHPEVRCVSDLD